MVAAKFCRALNSMLKNLDFIVLLFRIESYMFRTLPESLLGMQKLGSDPGLLHFNKIHTQFVGLPSLRATLHSTIDFAVQVMLSLILSVALGS